MKVANFTTTANFFHILRRQLLRDFRKPLVVFTPKSLLRHPKCISKIIDFTSGVFRDVIDDNSAIPDKIENVLLCSGKIYYDLLAQQESQEESKIAIIRIEQLYPFPEKQLEKAINRYKKAKQIVWVQEEPANMGAWRFISNLLSDKYELSLIARPASGSPATGSNKFHILRHQKIIDKAFDLCDCPYLKEDCKMGCIGNKWKSFEKEIREFNGKDMESNYHTGVKPLE